MQTPVEENVPEGQVETHLPFHASWLLLQNVDVSKQVLQEASQAGNKVIMSFITEAKVLQIQVRPSCADAVEPEGQVSTLLRKNPGRHSVHCF